MTVSESWHITVSTTPGVSCCVHGPEGDYRFIVMGWIDLESEMERVLGHGLGLFRCSEEEFLGHAHTDRLPAYRSAPHILAIRNMFDTSLPRTLD